MFGSTSLRRKRNWHPVPYIPQADEVDCGSACLAMVLSAFGRSTTISDVSTLCLAGRDGISAGSLLAAGRTLGLEGKAYKTAFANLEKIPLPAIVHWELTHWVVVERWTQKWVSIVDPKYGRRKLSHKEFSKSFTGILVILSKGKNFLARRRRRKSPFIAFFLSRVGAVNGWRIVFLVLGISLVVQMYSLFLPLLTKVIVDDIIPGARIGLMGLLGCAAALLILSNVLLGLFRTLLLAKVRTYLDAGAITHLVQKLLCADLEFFQVHSAGDLVSRVNSYTNIRQILTDWSLTTLLDGCLVFAYIVATALIDHTLALIATGFVIVQALVVILTHNRQKQLAYETSVAGSKQSSFLMEIVLGAHQLKAAGIELVASEHWAKHLFRQLNVENRQRYLTAFLAFIFGLCNFGGPIAVLWVGAVKVLKGEITPGAMLMASGLAAALFMPLARFVSAIQQLQVIAASIYRLDNIVSASPEKFRALPNRQQIAINGRIEVRNLTYTYPGCQEPAIRSLSFRIPAGSKIAIVGGTGSGKSTLLNLLLGLVSPDSGEILYDDIPIQELDITHLRTQIGVVLQDFRLFCGTIRQNLTLGAPKASIEQVIRAAELACIHEEIAVLPLAYETMLSDNGANFSGGQRQRLALARALLFNPRILVLDEATSHLDSRTEQIIDSTISDLHSTRIVIAHRLSTVANADRILVLEKGSLIEEGTHDRLLERNGMYSTLMASSFAWKQKDSPFKNGMAQNGGPCADKATARVEEVG